METKIVKIELSKRGLPCMWAVGGAKNKATSYHCRTLKKDNIKYDYLLEKNTDNTISVIKIKMEVM